MKIESKALSKLAKLYERSQAGKTGSAERDLILDYEGFLSEIGCQDGELRADAERELAEAAGAGVLRLISHRRDPRLVLQIRFSYFQEEALFRRLNKHSPTHLRQELARQFTKGKQIAVPVQWHQSWQTFCSKLELASLQGESIAPFKRDDDDYNAELLALVPKLLAWRGESLIRFASCVLCGDSKRLGELSVRIGQILASLTDGKLTCLEDLGIMANPRFVLLHGPLKLCLDNDSVDLGRLVGPFRLAEADILRTKEMETTAIRCLTIENETTFHELAKLQSGELLIQTSFPGSATLALLTRLPEAIELWHFGDTDPEGFEILRDLRERTQRSIRSLHMRYRPQESGPPLTPPDRAKIERLLLSPLMKPEREELEQMLHAGNIGLYEQESLGRPAYDQWPFY